MQVVRPVGGLPIGIRQGGAAGPHPRRGTSGAEPFLLSATLTNFLLSTMLTTFCRHGIQRSTRRCRAPATLLLPPPAGTRARQRATRNQTGVVLASCNTRQQAWGGPRLPALLMGPSHAALSPEQTWRMDVIDPYTDFGVYTERGQHAEVREPRTTDSAGFGLASGLSSAKQIKPTGFFERLALSQSSIDATLSGLEKRLVELANRIGASLFPPESPSTTVAGVKRDDQSEDVISKTLGNTDRLNEKAIYLMGLAGRIAERL